MPYHSMEKQALGREIEKLIKDEEALRDLYKQASEIIRSDSSDSGKRIFVLLVQMGKEAEEHKGRLEKVLEAIEKSDAHVF